jgi:ABC-type branched-subunit amino acid transport system substrate-binding protein
MVGGDTIYTPEILDVVGKEVKNCLVVAVPWHKMHSPDPKFPQASEKLWGGQVSWRTALAYDATRVLLTALQKSSAPSRLLLQQTLSNPNFKAMGATGTISFQANGDNRAGKAKGKITPLRRVVVPRRKSVIASPQYAENLFRFPPKENGYGGLS